MTVIPKERSADGHRRAGGGLLQTKNGHSMIKDSISFLCQKQPLSNAHNKRRGERVPGDPRERI
ncbi:hypothetical protein D0Z62_18415 [Providencia rettgeri]|nr:hypothetical protein D0Z62_18415 [Providencia rettgeri]